MYGCTGVQVPPFHTFYSHALGCVGMRCHSPYYWKLLEPPGTYRTLGFSWMCPAPQYLKCMAALVCRSPPFIHFIPMLWAVLACVAIPYFWKLLEPPGTPRILLDVPCPPVPEMYGCTDVQVPPLSYMTNRKPAVGVGELIAGAGGY